jgi:hemoglobin/transferrin/lactoferrin receptor protein
MSAAFAALATAASPALAEERGAPLIQVATVDSVTVTATRSEKKIDEAPATVSVITSQRIDDELATDIKDLVRFEAGVSVRTSPSRFTAAGSSTGRDGNSGFNIRGLEGNRVLILTDGVRVPDAYSFGAQSMGRGDYVDLDTLKSVEILRGPASALYGSDGVAGAVSYVTKDPADYLKGTKPWSLQASAGYASVDNSWSKGLVGAGKIGNWSGLIAYTRRDGAEQETHGSNTSPNITRTAANPQDIFSNAVLAKLVFEPSDQNRFRLTYDHLDHKTDSTVLSAIAVPPLSATSVLGLVATDSIHRDRVSLDHLYKSDGGLIDQAHSTVYWQKATTNEYSTEDRNTAADRTRIGTFNTRVLGAALELKSHFATGSIEHRLAYGGDYSVTHQDGIRDGTIPPVGETFPTRAFPTTDYTLAGAFVQDEISFLEGRLTAYPALRYDHYKLEPKTNDPLFTALAPASQSDSHVSPKIGLVFKATPQIGLFLNYGAGFKAPAPSQVNNGFANLVSNYRSVSNPALRPETSTTLEGGVRVHGAAWKASATAFTGDYDNFISQVQVGGTFTPSDPAIYQFVNLGKVKISGIEARAEATLGSGFSANFAAAYARGTSTTAGVSSPLDSVDPLKIVAGLSWRDREGRFGGQVIATHSEGKAIDRAGGTCGTTCFTPPAFTILDATGYWNITPSATLRAGVFNITDQKYWWWSDVRGLSQTSTVLDAYTSPGRNVGVSLTLRL